MNQVYLGSEMFLKGKFVRFVHSQGYMKYARPPLLALLIVMSSYFFFLPLVEKFSKQPEKCGSSNFFQVFLDIKRFLCMKCKILIRSFL